MARVPQVALPPAAVGATYSLLGSENPPAMSTAAETWYGRGTYPQSNGIYNVLNKINTMTSDSTNGKDPMYSLGRIAGHEIVRLTIGLVVSRKLQFVDAIYEIMDATYTNWRVQDGTFYRIRDDSSPMNMEILDVALYLGAYALGTLVLETNRGLTSPKGYNYATAADNWKPFIRTEAEAWWQSDSAVWKGLMNAWGGSSQRAATAGEFPYVLRSYTHTTTRTHLYAWALNELAPEARYLTDFDRHTQELLHKPNVVVDTDIDGFVWGWGVNGHGRTWDATPTTYADYHVDTALLFSLLGVGEWTSTHGARMARTFDNYVFDESTTNYIDNTATSSVARSIVGDVDRTVNTADGTVTYTIYTGRTRENYKYILCNSYPFLIVHDSGTRLRTIFEDWYQDFGSGQSAAPIAFMVYHALND